MENESRHIRYLIVIAAMLCAVIIGYNAFYVPDADMSKLSVVADTATSAASSGGASEEYTPKSVTGAASNIVASQAAAGSSVKAESASAVASGRVQGKVNINTATAKQLSEGLTGIGDTLAQRIVAYRELNGKFKSIEEIKKVSGIGDKKFENIHDSITV